MYNQRKRSASEVKLATHRELSKLTMPALQLIAAEEKVVLPEVGRILKSHYIEAIVLSRHPANEDVDDAEVGLPEDKEESEVVPAEEGGETNNDESIALEDERAVLAKKFIAVNTTDELKAIVAKEKIDMGPGRKTKSSYVEAIYLARLSK